MQLISRDEARTTNQTWYFTGLECTKGHVDKRYVKTGICYQCKRERNKSTRDNYPETYKEIRKRQYTNNREKILSKNEKWKNANKDKVLTIKKRNKDKHRTVYNKSERIRNREKRKNPHWRLSRNLSKAIWDSLKSHGGKIGPKWDMLPYTPQELISHLEAEFDENMSWDNYGTYWQLDHIKPLSWFNLETEFLDAWALSNLQPLESSKNASKCNRYIG